MANWIDISRNAKTHGDFAGRSYAEQDAYFEFFAGSEPGDRDAIAARVRKIFARIQSVFAARGFRRPQIGVASFKSTSSP